MELTQYLSQTKSVTTRLTAGMEFSFGYYTNRLNAQKLQELERKNQESREKEARETSARAAAAKKSKAKDAPKDATADAAAADTAESDANPADEAREVAEALGEFSLLKQYENYVAHLCDIVGLVDATTNGEPVPFNTLEDKQAVFRAFSYDDLVLITKAINEDVAGPLEPDGTDSSDGSPPKDE